MKASEANKIIEKYHISSVGSVRNKKTNRELKQRISNAGYFRVQLYIENKSKTFAVHRLVAMKFIANPNQKKCVNHKDGDKLNNDSSNLEWVTHKRNSIHSVENGMTPVGEKVNKAKLKECDVKVIRHCLECNVCSGAYLARLLGVTKELIYRIRDRKTWRHI